MAQVWLCTRQYYQTCASAGGVTYNKTDEGNLLIGQAHGHNLHVAMGCRANIL